MNEKSISPPGGLSWINLMDYFNKFIYSRKNIDLENTILITGTPRSGTTWLMEIVSMLPSYTYLFEPLNPVWYPISFETGFQSRTYLPTSYEWSAGERYLEKVFTGKVFSKPLNPDQFSTHMPKGKISVIMSRLLANKLIVKSVNIIRLLPWVSQRFKLRKVLILLRHPCAVISSQLKTGLCGYHQSNPPYDYVFPNQKQILNEAKKIGSLPDGAFNILKDISHIEELLAASWCLDYYTSLLHCKKFDWSFVFYEKLLTDGENELRKIFNSIGEKINTAHIQRLNVPSMTSPINKTESINNKNKQLTQWKKTLSKQQINRILKIVSSFNLELYSDQANPLPTDIYIESKKQ